MTLGKHLTMSASASVFFIAIDYKNKTNMKVADSWCLRDHCKAEILRGLDMNLLLNSVKAALVKIIIKLILIFLSHSFLNLFMKTKNEK